MLQQRTVSTDARTTNNMSHGELAVKYAEQGFLVFPLKGSYAAEWKQAKTPLKGTHGHNDSTDDIEQVKAWWAQYPNAMIGLRTGIANDFTVIDIDGDEDGDFVKLLEDYAKKVDCPVIETSRGHHYYFTYTPELANRSDIRPSVDIRTEGGYVVAPCSQHLHSGYGYNLLQGKITNVCEMPNEILGALLPNTEKVIDAPRCSSNLSIDSENLEVDLDKLEDALDLIPSDNYSDWITVGMALRNALGEEGLEVWDSWSQESSKYDGDKMYKKWGTFSNPTRGKKVGVGTIFHMAKLHGWQPDITNSGHEWPEPLLVNPELPPVKALTKNMLPAAIGDYVMDAAKRMECPADYIAVSAITALSGAIGSRCAIQPKQLDTEWKVAPNLWTAIIGSPGAKKSPAIDAGLKPLKELEANCRREHDSAMNNYTLDKVRYEEAKKLGNKQKEGEELVEHNSHIPPVEPEAKRHIVNSVTVQSLGEVLASNPHGLVIERDELAGFLNRVDHRDFPEDKAFYLSLWNGYGSFSFDTIGRGTTSVEKMCGSVIGSIQPSKLQQYLNKILEGTNNDGMIQRFQLLVYPDVPPYEGMVDQSPNYEAYKQFHEAVFRLSEIDFTTIGAKHDNGFTYFQFTSDAQPLFVQWYNTLQKQLRGRKNEAIVDEHLAKYPKLMPALALIFQLAQSGDKRIDGVGVDATKQAIKWCEYLESHARRVYSQQMTMNRGVVKLAEMLNNGKLEDIFSLKDVYHNEPAGLHNSKLAQAACLELEQMGWIKSVMVDKKKRYQINPKILGQQTIH